MQNLFLTLNSELSSIFCTNGKINVPQATNFRYKHSMQAFYLVDKYDLECVHCIHAHDTHFIFIFERNNVRDQILIPNYALMGYKNASITKIRSHWAQP